MALFVSLSGELLGCCICIAAKRVERPGALRSAYNGSNPQPDKPNPPKLTVHKTIMARTYFCTGLNNKINNFSGDKNKFPNIVICDCFDNPLIGKR